MKISWVILTYERQEVVNKTFYHNCNNINYSDNSFEIIHIDNGSWKSNKFEFNGDIVIKNKFNRGVARGYNQGLVMATGDFVLITGCDRIMPENFLAKMIECFDLVSTTGIVSCYSKPIDQVPERKRKSSDGLQHCLPMEARMLSRKLFREIGYFREDFGLYGYEDLEWADRAERVTKEKGLINYLLPGPHAEHIGSEGNDPWNGKDDKEYHAFKQRECKDPRKLELYLKCKAEGNPYYNPFL